MFEETNQTNETQETNEGLFDDFTSSDTNEDAQYSDPEENAENDTVDESNEGNTNPQSSEPEKYEVVYNGQKMSLTLDELKTNAQKGMNYDHVYNQFQDLKKSPVMGIIENYAKKNNMTTDQYIQYLQEIDTQQKVSAMTADGVPEATAKRLIELEEKENARAEREAAEQQRDNEKKQLNDFIKMYPNVEPADIPQEVWQSYNSGMDLVSAYAIYENKVLKTKLTQFEKNETNKQKSVGSVKGDNTEASSDAFLEGLFG